MNERINFNPTTLNIFTDASVKQMMYGFDSCSGIIAIIGDHKLAEQIKINRNTTNNFGELYAIQMAVQLAFDAKRLLKQSPKYINIFSDSLISVRGLREWYNGWGINEEHEVERIVANKEIIARIISMIIDYEINISLFHIKGHVNFNKNSDIHKAIQKFYQHNKDTGEIDFETMKLMLQCNDYVDNSTRNFLQQSENVPITIRPIERLLMFSDQDLEKYRNLINPEYQK